MVPGAPEPQRVSPPSSDESSFDALRAHIDALFQVVPFGAHEIGADGRYLFLNDVSTRPYGLRPAGSFHDLEAGELERQIRERLAQAAEFRQRASALRLQRRQALDRAGQLLKLLLEKLAAERIPN